MIEPSAAWVFTSTELLRIRDGRVVLRAALPVPEWEHTAAWWAAAWERAWLASQGAQDYAGAQAEAWRQIHAEADAALERVLAAR